MKKLLLLLATAFTIGSFAQTREADYNYILSRYDNQQIDANYKEEVLTKSEHSKNQTKTSIQFVNFSTGSVNRGIAVVYTEKDQNNEVKKFKAYCIPAKGSSEAIFNKAFLEINKINNQLLVKYILMGLIQLGVDTD